MKRYMVVLVSFILALLFPSLSSGAEKLKFGTSIRTYAPYYLPVMAAEEKGFWRDNGLEAEWVPFRGGGPFMQALAAGAMRIGYTAAATVFQAGAGGVPVVMISDLYPREEFFFWVKPDSRFREPKDLKGARIGISTLASTPHAYGRLVAKALGLEKDVRFVSVGDVTTAIAAIKSGAIDATIRTFGNMAELKLKGEIQDLVRVNDYLPKEWADMVMVAHKELTKSQPATVARAVKAHLQAIQFITRSPQWAIEKMKAMEGFSEEAARQVFAMASPLFTRDGKISKPALENVRAFLIENGIVPKEKAPAVDEIYTEDFVK